MWRETIATVVAIGEDADGNADLEELRCALVKYEGRTRKIGSFSAGSNVSGICADVAAVTRLLHAHGALSFWDFAGAGPYVKIDIGSEPRMDGVYLSPHKFVGGPGTAGVLVARRSVFANRVPSAPGGGTVAWVSPDAQVYDTSIENREDGGTPGILQAIRCGLVFRIKEMVGSERIERIEQRHARHAIESWSRNPNIHLIGGDRGAYNDPAKKRLSIISFNIRYNKGPKILHQHFVVALLNDLYGIQARSGCSCAGPYEHRVLGIGEEQSCAFEKAIAEGDEVSKPGWARVNFNYFLPDAEVEYIIQAVHQIADHGWKLLPMYAANPKNGQWFSRRTQAQAQLGAGGGGSGGSGGASPAGAKGGVGGLLMLGDLAFDAPGMKMRYRTPTYLKSRSKAPLAMLPGLYTKYLEKAIEAYGEAGGAISRLPDGQWQNPADPTAAIASAQKASARKASASASASASANKPPKPAPVQRQFTRGLGSSRGVKALQSNNSRRPESSVREFMRSLSTRFTGTPAANKAAKAASSKEGGGGGSRGKSKSGLLLSDFIYQGAFSFMDGSEGSIQMFSQAARDARFYVLPSEVAPAVMAGRRSGGGGDSPSGGSGGGGGGVSSGAHYGSGVKLGERAPK
jgi:selenocysteine lyase/cysteine desulfurase